MLDHLIDQAQHTAAKTARTAALGFAASLFIGVGCAFLTVAAWVLLVALTDMATAALIIGGTYSGTGCLIFAVMLSQKSDGAKHSNASQKMETPTAQDQPLAHVIAAFLSGVQAGRQAR